MAAFVGGLSSVSLPTHVAGYFLPQISQTALLWATVAVSAVYAALCVSSFFRVMEEAVSAGYRALIRVRFDEKSEEGRRTKEVHDGIEREWRGRMQTLSRINWAAAVSSPLDLYKRGVSADKCRAGNARTRRLPLCRALRARAALLH